MKLPDRKLFDYDKFRDYLATGNATAVDFIIRDQTKRTLLTFRDEEPVGYHFPGGIVLPNENPEEIVVWVAKKELDWNILEE